MLQHCKVLRECSCCMVLNVLLCIGRYTAKQLGSRHTASVNHCRCESADRDSAKQLGPAQQACESGCEVQPPVRACARLLEGFCCSWGSADLWDDVSDHAVSSSSFGWTFLEASMFT